MKHILLFISALLLALLPARAQYVTYNHDATKMNQVTVMETGVGTLKPAAFYLLHSKYEKTAMSSNKLGQRTITSGSKRLQVSMAEQIDTSLNRRAKIEALNMADRQIDLAWQSEGSRITEQMENYQGNILKIIISGGKPSEMNVWQEHYNLFQTAITATRQAYMPNSLRKKEYLKISQEIAHKNAQLIKYLTIVSSRTHTQTALNATLYRNVDNGSIAEAARSRWMGDRTNVITE